MEYLTDLTTAANRGDNGTIRYYALIIPVGSTGTERVLVIPGGDIARANAWLTQLMTTHCPRYAVRMITERQAEVWCAENVRVYGSGTMPRVARRIILWNCPAGQRGCDD